MSIVSAFSTGRLSVNVDSATLERRCLVSSQRPAAGAFSPRETTWWHVAFWRGARRACSDGRRWTPWGAVCEGGRRSGVGWRDDVAPAEAPGTRRGWTTRRQRTNREHRRTGSWEWRRPAGCCSTRHSGPGRPPLLPASVGPCVSSSAAVYLGRRPEGWEGVASERWRADGSRPGDGARSMLGVAVWSG